MLGWKCKPVEGDQQELNFTLPANQEEVLNLIKEHPEYTINDMIVKLGKSYADLSDLLFQLEMADLIVAVPGGRYAHVEM
jgi:predicted Rossmann fold nucleotide-binding protein DprA/Smf involved in DNA uptake